MSGAEQAKDASATSLEAADASITELDDSTQVPAGFPSRQLPPRRDAAAGAAGAASAGNAVAGPSKSDGPSDQVAQQTKQLEELFKNLTAGAVVDQKKNAMAMAAMQEQLGLARKMDKNVPKGPDAHKFWGTQPVPQHSEKVESDGAIEPNKTEEEIRKEPLPLPKEYEWCLVDVTAEEEVC
jgi:hypothetical protein